MYEEASTCKIQTSDILSEAENDDYDDDNIRTTPEKKPIIETQKSAQDPLELHEASSEVSTAYKALTNERSVKEDDDCDLFCKMLAKQIKEYPKLEREEIMYELHGVMINRRRRYNVK